MPISWGSEPPPHLKAKAQPVTRVLCPHCGHESKADRDSKAHKLLATHIRKKHPEKKS